MSSPPIPETTENKVQVPSVLAKFCRRFFAHFYEFYVTPDEAVALGLNGLSQEEKLELAPILDEVTGPSYSAGDLLKLWRSSPADVHFADGEELRLFLKRARAKIS